MPKEIIVLNVLGMTCSHCENAVKTAVSGLDGVSDVTVDLPSGQVTVGFDSDKVDSDAIRYAIEDQGYDVE
jgi:copper chaperone